MRSSATSPTSDPSRAWAPFEPSRDRKWDLPAVAHLHRRAGFAASWPVLERDLREGPSASIERLLAGSKKSVDGSPAAEFESTLDLMASQLTPASEASQLQAIWLYRMIFTPDPLRERLTYFWHNHFATSIAKVKNAVLMQRQNNLMRTHALSGFRALLSAIGKDPAMLIWLDSTINRKAKPNENYAREVMELFTLGRGHYSEKDVQEAARAFTGWFVVQDQFKEVAKQHDDGTKTVLGKKGNWTGDDIPGILIDQPACAEWICRKLFRHFVSETVQPPEALIAPLARAFRDSSYRVEVPVAMILRSNLFHDPSVRRHRVKSPIEFAVGLVRSLEILDPTVQAVALAESCGQMGQSLYAPPSVAGWNDGPSWINSTTLLARANLALGILSDQNQAFGQRLNPAALAARHGFKGRERAAVFFNDLLVQDAFEQAAREPIKKASKSAVSDETAASDVVRLILTSPEYQLC
jgi:uncharacterized protein (DUF1800 family)